MGGQWKGYDNFDYLCHMKSIKIPLICITDGDDDLIGNVEGCVDLFRAIGSRNKCFHVCGDVNERVNTNLVHGTHIDNYCSKEYADEAWLTILCWISDAYREQGNQYVDL